MIARGWPRRWWPLQATRHVRRRCGPGVSRARRGLRGSEWPGNILRCIIGWGETESMDTMSDSMNTFTLRALPPFDLALTVAVTRRRPTNLVDTWSDGVYRRVLRVGGRERLIAVRQTGPATVEVSVLDGLLTNGERDELSLLLERMLGLARDLTPVVAAFSCYEPLARLLVQLEGMKPPRYPDLWTTLVGVVPYQQVSLEAGQAI